jgi:hypothetical protein
MIFIICDLTFGKKIEKDGIIQCFFGAKSFRQLGITSTNKNPT